MKYIKVKDGDIEVKVAVTRKFKKEYLKGKSALENASKKLKKATKNPILNNEKRGFIGEKLKARAKRIVEKAENLKTAKEDIFTPIKKKFNDLKREAKNTPILQKAKIKYPSIADSADAKLEKKKRRRKLALIASATVLLSAAAIILTGGIAALGIPGLAAAAPLISELAVPAFSITVLATATIAGIGTAIFKREHNGLKKYIKTEVEIEQEKKDNTKTTRNISKKSNLLTSNIPLSSSSSISSDKTYTMENSEWESFSDTFNDKKYTPVQRATAPPAYNPDYQTEVEIEQEKKDNTKTTRNISKKSNLLTSTTPLSSSSSNKINPMENSEWESFSDTFNDKKYTPVQRATAPPAYSPDYQPEVEIKQEEKDNTKPTRNILKKSNPLTSNTPLSSSSSSISSSSSSSSSSNKTDPIKNSQRASFLDTLNDEKYTPVPPATAPPAYNPDYQPVNTNPTEESLISHIKGKKNTEKNRKSKEPEGILFTSADVERVMKKLTKAQNIVKENLQKLEENKIIDKASEEGNPRKKQKREDSRITPKRGPKPNNPMAKTNRYKDQIKKNRKRIRSN